MKKNYGIEEALQIANREIISLSYQKDENFDTHVDFALTFADEILDGLKTVSPFIRNLRPKLSYGGSFFNNTKINYPDEFDINILLSLPNECDLKVRTSNVPGYVNCLINDLDATHDQLIHDVLEDFIDEKDYLLTEPFLEYMKKQFRLAVKENLRNNVIEVNGENFNFQIDKKNGVAITIHSQKPNFNVSIDFVFCIIIDGYDWPDTGFMKNPYPDEPYFALPKKPSNGKVTNEERCWRISSAPSEKKLLHNMYNMKPTIRLIKEINLVHGFDDIINSHFVQNMFLNELKNKTEDECEDFWMQGLSVCLEHMLGVYLDCLDNGNISYFWYKKFNLITEKPVNSRKLFEIREKISEILDEIKKPNNGRYFLRFFCTRQKYFELKKSGKI